MLLFFFICIERWSDRDREGLHPDLFWIERGWHPVCPTICVMFLASHQALLSGNSARRLMCAGGAAEYSANSAQQIWILCHMTAPKGAGKSTHYIWNKCHPMCAVSFKGNVTFEICMETSWWRSARLKQVTVHPILFSYHGRLIWMLKKDRI